MNPVLALGLVAAAGIAVTRLPRLFPTLPAFDVIRAAGTALVLLGLLLGPGIGVLDAATLSAVSPLTLLALGWIGAAFGVQLNGRLLRRLQLHTVWLAAVQAAAAFVTVVIGAWLLTDRIPALAAAWVPRVPAVLALGAIAAVSGPRILHTLLEGTGARWPLVSKFAVAATLDTGFGVLVFTGMLAAFAPERSLGTALWLLLTLGSGLLIGLLFLSVTRLRHDDPDLALSLFGCILLGAGVGYAGGLDPFVVCVVAGAVLGALSPQRRRVAALLGTWERPAAAVLLVTAGALLQVPTVWVPMAAAALAAVRILARWAAVRYARLPFWHAATFVPGDAGLVGVGQGTIAVALAVSYALVHGGTVLTAVVIGVALAQLAAPLGLSRGLRPVRLTPASADPEVTG